MYLGSWAGNKLHGASHLCSPVGAVSQYGCQVAHGASGHKQCCLFACQLSSILLQRIHCGVLSIHIIATVSLQGKQPGAAVSWATYTAVDPKAKQEGTPGHTAQSVPALRLVLSLGQLVGNEGGDCLASVRCSIKYP